jgi:superfamily II DNA/RNA helicase/HKD family nuclease
VSDIVDNRREKLVDTIGRILESTESARFAVGYFFVSGLTAVQDRLEDVKELRLLIGNTSNRETIEQMAEDYRRLEMVAGATEEQLYQKGAEARRVARLAAQEVGDSLEVMDQTDEGEELVKTLVRLIEEGRLEVRVYTRGRLHSKAYIFDYEPDGRYEKGIAVIGSSNFTLAGISHNTELNVVVHGNENHAELGEWFEELWDEAEDFDESLMEEMKRSWAIAPTSPYDVYMKTLYALVRDRLEGEERARVVVDSDITEQLADFQRVAFRQAVGMIEQRGGAFVSDVVGLGKSYIGAAIVSYFERTERARPLIVCPKPLVEMWERYNEVYQLNARVLSMSMLREGGEGATGSLLDDVRYRDRDFVLVDESHNFRNRDIQRYRLLEEFLSSGKKCCFLTATPRNKSAWDIYNQIKLFHQDDTTDLPIDPPNLREFFRLVEKGERDLPELLGNILLRRTRNHILRWYGRDSETGKPVDSSRFDEYLSGKRRAYVLVDGRHQFFPKRRLETVSYSIEAAYAGLYDELRRYLGKPREPGAEPPDNELTYARYGLWRYVLPGKRDQEPYVTLRRAGFNLRGLIRVLLFKRFESSVHAFRETVRRLLRAHKSFLAALEEEIVPAGEEAENILIESDPDEETQVVDALRAVSGRYAAEDFRLDLLKEHIRRDLRLLEKILSLVEPIRPDNDAKLQTLKERLTQEPLRSGKCLVFTQYADTARYLHENLNPGGKRDDVDVIFSGDKSKARAVGRFAPRANPEYLLQPGESELSMLIATDVLAEGLNMQDCDKIVNYDLHWNPVRLIQRFGRIDRIGSKHGEIFGFNFLPETGIEENLGLGEILRERIKEIQATIGEDAAILEPGEKLNEEAMYAIYERDETKFEGYEEDEEDFSDLGEAVELFRQLRDEDPEEYERIASLRDGIRTGKCSDHKGLYVFCQAGSYRQLYLLDEDGEVASRDLRHVLRAISCERTEPFAQLPAGYNAAVMRVRERFEREVRERRAERENRRSRNRGQRYVRRELQVLFAGTEEAAVRERINALERPFGGPLVSAVERRLNQLQRQGARGDELLQELESLYSRYRMYETPSRREATRGEDDTPRVVCSEALM